MNRDGSYYDLIGMEVGQSTTEVVQASVQLEQDLKPFIRAALR